MEQILLYIVTISGFSGFMLGLYSLLIPVLQKRGFSLPFVRRDAAEETDYDTEFDDEAAMAFAATGFKARRTSLLDRLPTRGSRRDDADEEEEAGREDGELLGDIDLSRERAQVAAEDDEEYEDDELAGLTLEAEVDPVLEELAAEEEADDEVGDEAEDVEDEEYEDEDEDEEGEEEEEEQQPDQPAVHVVSGGGDGNDMLALFDEGSDVAKEVEAWREGLPNPGLDELLAEARAIREMLSGRRPRQ